jgi:hypothetical protein
MSRVPGSLAYWKWTEPSGSSEKRPSRTTRWKWKWGLRAEPCSVEEGDGAELGLCGGGEAALQQEGADRAQQDAQDGSGERRVAGQEGAQSLRQREDPLPHGEGRQHLVVQMGGDLDHPAGVAGGADAAPLAREGNQSLGAALPAAGARKAVGEDAAAEIGAEVVLGPGGDTLATGIGVGGHGEEALEMVLDDGVERGGGRVPPAVHGVGTRDGCSGPCRRQASGGE